MCQSPKIKLGWEVIFLYFGTGKTFKMFEFFLKFDYIGEATQILRGTKSCICT